jgi:hypothetical protein
MLQLVLERFNGEAYRSWKSLTRLESEKQNFVEAISKLFSPSKRKGKGAAIEKL